MYYIGLMSGTSMDAIDVVVADLDDQSATVLAYQQFPIPEKIQLRVRAVKRSSSIDIITELDVILAGLFADAVCSLLDSSGLKAEDIVAIGSHGQTVLHLPEDQHPRTLQIGDANIIARLTGITTVADFRRMDIAAGGQGAPLAPGFHAWYFKSFKGKQLILNIGGMANLTILNGDDVTGFDSGPGNALLDDWIRQHKGLDFDRDGRWASSGQCHDALLNSMLDCDYFGKKTPKSTGKDEFNLIWLSHLIDQCKEKPSVVDVQATLLQLSAQTISDAICEHAGDAVEIIVCGGGCHNIALMGKLEKLLEDKVISCTDKYDIDPDAVEAIAFAWLAKQRLDGKPGNLPSVTGATQPVILGAIYQPVKS